MRLVSKSKNPLAEALQAAMRSQSSAMGTAASPPLPASLGGSVAAQLRGSAPSTGEALPSLSGPPRGVGSKGPELPSLARANAISRRLNGRAPKGKQLKGL